MTMFSIGPFAGFFGRLRPRGTHELSNKQQAAKRVYDIAKNAGDVSSAVDIANRYGLDQSLAECDSLWDILRSKCSDDRAKGRHLLALVAPWSRVSGEESTVVFVEEALKCDPSLLLRAALLSGISSTYRAQLIKRILATGDITPADLYQAFRLLSMRERTQFAERCVEYALSKNDVKNAYEIALWAMPATRDCLSEEVRTRLIQAILSSPADTVGKRADHLKWATHIA